MCQSVNTTKTVHRPSFAIDSIGFASIPAMKILVEKTLSALCRTINLYVNVPKDQVEILTSNAKEWPDANQIVSVQAIELV
jgi:hypothetical protein